MAYILYKTNGVKLTTIEDGSIDKSSTSLTLVGKNYSGYGQSINQNLIKLTENFSHNVQPLHSLTGQIWYDTGTKSLRIYNGTRYRKISLIDSGNTGKPSDAVEGNLFFDDTEQKLYYYNGNSWLLVGPQFTGLTSDVLIKPVEAIETNSDTHYILEHQVGINSIAAITSFSSFTPSSGSPISGFTAVKAGISLFGTNSNGVSSTGPANGFLFWGTSSDSLRFGGKLPASYVSTESPTLSQRLSITVDSGIVIGSGGGSLILRVDTATTGQNSYKEAVISAPASGSVIRFYSNSGNTVANILNIDSSNGLALLPTKSTDSGTNIGAAPGGTTPSRKPFLNIYGDYINATYLLKTGVYTSDSERDTRIIDPQPGMIILNGTKFQGYVGGAWVNLN